MPDEFVSLAVFLRVPPRESDPRVEPEAVAEPAAAPEDLAEAIRAARRFRAGLADALDAALAQLLEAIARDVLGRELALAPADVALIAARALHDFAPEKALSIRAHPDDVQRLRDLQIEGVADSALRHGDIVVELRSGTIDMRMEARLGAVLAACAQNTAV